MQSTGEVRLPRVSFCCSTVSKLRKKYASTEGSMVPLRRQENVTITLDDNSLCNVPVEGCDPKKDLIFINCGMVDGGEYLAVPRQAIVSHNGCDAKKAWKEILSLQKK